MQPKRAELVDHCMAGVVAALKTNDHIGVLGEKVDNTPLTLVAPLGAYDCAYRHRDTSLQAGAYSLRQPNGPIDRTGGTSNRQAADLAAAYVKHIQCLLRHKQQIAA